MSYLNETEKPKKKGKQKINDFRVWKQSKNLKANDIIFNANENQRTIKHFSSILNEEETNQKVNKRRTYKKVK